MDIGKLKTEIDTDPLVRGYAAMTDIQVADDMNLVNRDGVNVSIEDIIKFLLLDNTHSTDGDDTQDRSIWQRMKEVVALSDTPTAAVANPWNSTAIGNITEIQQIKTHQLLEFFTLSAQGDLPVDINDSNFRVYLTGAESAGCMSAAQKTAFLALINNKQTRGQELGIGKVKEGHVQEARL
jgi:hypothetical protein